MHTPKKGELAEVLCNGQNIINEFKHNLRTSVSPSKHRHNQSSPFVKSSSKPKQVNNHFSRRKLPPIFSQTTLRNDYSSEIELSLLGENNNLKYHNNFLVGQIKVLFKREKIYRRELAASQARIHNLEEINMNLQARLKKISQSVMGEIERLQRLIEAEVVERRADCIVQNVDGKVVGLQTQSSVYQNLQELKSKMESMLPRREENAEFVAHLNSVLKAHVKKSSMDERMKTQLQNLQLWSSTQLMGKKGHHSQQSLPNPRGSQMREYIQGGTKKGEIL